MEGDIVEQLTSPFKLRPEHKILERLVGTWRFESTWNIQKSVSTEFTGTMVNTSVFGGLFIESVVSTGSTDFARATYGYDNLESHYFTHSYSVAAPIVFIERGQYIAADNALRFRCLEPAEKGSKPVLVERVIQFISRDRIAKSLSYPEFPPEDPRGFTMTLFRQREDAG